MNVSRIWKVFGQEGHRQRTSFESSNVYEDLRACTRVELYNSDRTGTHQYSIVKIFAINKDECFNTLIAHISDGIFENSKVGKIQEISEEDFKNIIGSVDYIKTGYERVRIGDKYYCSTRLGETSDFYEDGGSYDTKTYRLANYYSSKSVADANNRADILYCQLRRFAVEHREKKIDWENTSHCKYNIYFCYTNKKIDISDTRYFQDFGTILFDSPEAAELAIDTYKEELMWYFTEYRDSL